MFIEALKTDIKYGEGKEDELKNKLENHFNCKLEKTSKLNLFDYIDKQNKILIELKSRRNEKNKYDTTMIGMNKVNKSIEKIKDNWNIYYVFNFTDLICYYKFEELNNDWISNGGRKDRGRYEYKKYYFIPISKLNNI